MTCEHNWLIDLDIGLITGETYCLKCGEHKQGNGIFDL